MIYNYHTFAGALSFLSSLPRRSQMKNPQTRRFSTGIEYPKRRFGIIAIEKRFITVDQLWEALIQQAHQKERVHIGEILRKMGFITDSQLNEVLDLANQDEALSRRFEVYKGGAGGKKAV
jgi:hypothetical protein